MPAHTAAVLLYNRNECTLGYKLQLNTRMDCIQESFSNQCVCSTYRDKANSAVILGAPDRLCNDTSNTLNKCAPHVTGTILEPFNKVSLLTTLLCCCLC
jgi:hypothetical protein